MKRPDGVYCLPVETRLPWDPSRKFNVRELDQNCEYQVTPQFIIGISVEMLNCFTSFAVFHGSLD
jgi:hypothetical protein